MTPSAGCLLVANESLRDPNFRRTVVYLVEHHDEGSLGLILNRPLTIPLGELWGDCPASLRHALAAADGGPVEREKGLLLHRDLSIPDAATMGTGLAIGGNIAALGSRWAKGPDAFGPRLFLGHSGWTPGQLADEISAGTWQIHPGTPAIVFADAQHIWERLTHGGFFQPSLN